MIVPPRQLRSAQQEVRRTAHDQDLVEVPKRARLDREREHTTLFKKTQGGPVNDPKANV